jgi:hypothetical protein
MYNAIVLSPTSCRRVISLTMLQYVILRAQCLKQSIFFAQDGWGRKTRTIHSHLALRCIHGAMPPLPPVPSRRGDYFWYKDTSVLISTCKIRCFLQGFGTAEMILLKLIRVLDSSGSGYVPTVDPCEQGSRVQGCTKHKEYSQ